MTTRSESITYKLLRTSTIWRKSSRAFYQEKFGISLVEVGVLLVIADKAPLSLLEVRKRSINYAPCPRRPAYGRERR